MRLSGKKSRSFGRNWTLRSPPRRTLNSMLSNAPICDECYVATYRSVDSVNAYSCAAYPPSARDPSVLFGDHRRQQSQRPRPIEGANHGRSCYPARAAPLLRVAGPGPANPSRCTVWLSINFHSALEENSCASLEICSLRIGAVGNEKQLVTHQISRLASRPRQELPFPN